MQGLIATGFAMLISIVADSIEPVSIGKTHATKGLKLLRTRLQFEFG